MTNYGICTNTLIAIRKEPSEQTEMVTQLLFGETYSIIETQEKWVKITSLIDNYEGWIDAKLVTKVSETEVTSYNKNSSITQTALSKLLDVQSKHFIPLVAGSIIPQLNANNSFTINNCKYRCR